MTLEIKGKADIRTVKGFSSRHETGPVPSTGRPVFVRAIKPVEELAKRNADLDREKSRQLPVALHDRADGLHEDAQGEIG